MIESGTATADGTAMRYTVVLRPTENIDANWEKVGMNDRPGINDTYYYKGQLFAVGSCRKNF